MSGSLEGTHEGQGRSIWLTTTLFHRRRNANVKNGGLNRTEMNQLQTILCDGEPF